MSEQSMEALAKATLTRSARRLLKEKLRHGEISFHDALDLPCTQTMEIRKLLIALPRIREAKSQKWLRVLGISPSAAVQDLSESRRRQLEELVG